MASRQTLAQRVVNAASEVQKVSRALVESTSTRPLTTDAIRDLESAGHHALGEAAENARAIAEEAAREGG